MRVFCASMADVFEDRADLVEPRARLFELIDNTPFLDWLLLTKRPENLERFYPSEFLNVWLGVTAENQEQADKRIPKLVQAPAAIKFVSCEPLLEKVDLELRGRNYGIGNEYINWVIVGGESGPKARPFEWVWARDIRDQCKQVGVPFFMKQGGGWPNKREKLEDIPEDLQIREFPKRGER